MPEYEGKNKGHIHSKVTSRNYRTILYRFSTKTGGYLRIFGIQSRSMEIALNSTVQLEFQ